MHTNPISVKDLLSNLKYLTSKSFDNKGVYNSKNSTSKPEIIKKSKKKIQFKKSADKVKNILFNTKDIVVSKPVNVKYSKPTNSGKNIFTKSVDSALAVDLLAFENMFCVYKTDLLKNQTKNNIQKHILSTNKTFTLSLSYKYLTKQFQLKSLSTKSILNVFKNVLSNEEYYSDNNLLTNCINLFLSNEELKSVDISDKKCISQMENISYTITKNHLHFYDIFTILLHIDNTNYKNTYEYLKTTCENLNQIYNDKRIKYVYQLLNQLVYLINDKYNMHQINHKSIENDAILNYQSIKNILDYSYRGHKMSTFIKETFSNNDKLDGESTKINIKLDQDMLKCINNNQIVVHEKMLLKYDEIKPIICKSSILDTYIHNSLSDISKSIIKTKSIHNNLLGTIKSVEEYFCMDIESVVKIYSKIENEVFN